jgi:hypothetical protein
MRFTVVSWRGEGLPIAMRLKQEGHAVALLTADYCRVGEGLVPLVEGPTEQTDEAQTRFHGKATLSNIKSCSTKDTVIIFTNAGFGEIADSLAKVGYLVLGAGLFQDNLRGNANFTKMVNSMYEVESSLDGQGVNCVLEGWFNGEDFIYPLFGAIQEYAFMAGNVGPAIDCAGATYFAFKNFRPVQFQRSLGRIKPLLKKLNYKGPISVDMCGDNVIRYIPGFRFDSMYVFMQLLQQELGSLFIDTLRGMVKQMKCSFDYGVTIRATVPPYPHATREPGTAPLGRLDHWLEQGISLTGVREEGGMLYPASFNGEVCATVHTAATIKEAQAGALRAMSSILTLGMQFRVDIAGIALKTIGPILSYGMNKNEVEHGRIGQGESAGNGGTASVESPARG